MPAVRVLLAASLLLAGCVAGQQAAMPPEIHVAPVEGAREPVADDLRTAIAAALRARGFQVRDTVGGAEGAPAVLRGRVVFDAETLLGPYPAILQWSVERPAGTAVAWFRQGINVPRATWEAGEPDLVRVIASDAANRAIASPWSAEERDALDVEGGVATAAVIVGGPEGARAVAVDGGPAEPLRSRLHIPLPMDKGIEPPKSMGGLLRDKVPERPGPAHAAPVAREGDASARAGREKDAPPVSTVRPAAPAPQGPLLLVADVVGAPGDGNAALTRGMIGALRGRGHDLTAVASEASLTIFGQVEVDPRAVDSPMVRIRWRVVDRAGKEIGVVNLQNPIPAGILNDRWGPLGEAAARGGAAGVEDLLRLWKDGPRGAKGG